MPFDLHPIDLLLLLLLLLAGLGGWRQGLAMVVLGYAGLLAGLAVGAWVAVRVGLFVSPRISVSRVLVAAVVFCLVTGVFSTLGNLLGRRVRSLLAGRWTSRLDAVGGALVASAVLAVAVWFVALTLRPLPYPPLARALTSSTVLRTIDRYAPRPPTALAKLRALLDRSLFPDVFTTLRPPVAPRRPPPNVDTAGVWQAAARAVQIQSRGCGGLLFGSGFPLQPGLVVTAAHVVAGTSDPQVVTRDGSRVPATVVFFDPDRDLALLRVPTLDLQPLRLAPAAGNGQPAALVGYPGGGRELVVGAQVVAEVTAHGSDIYAKGRALRQVYVLSARVRQGDSGGPVVDLDGRDLGVVFAASTASDSTGYALTDGELRAALAAAGAAREPVGVGACAI
jgi:S1-C subfamily serine protease